MPADDFVFMCRNIKRLLGIKKDAELAVKLGISPQAVAGAKKKGTVPITWFDTIEEKFGIPREVFDLPPGVAIPHHGSRLVPMVAVPLLGKVPAGIPEEIAEQVEEYIALPGVTEGSYALRVKGQSMAPNIHHDDTVLFRIDQEARPGDVVVVNDEFGDSMLKRLKKKDDEYWLTSDNPEYPAVRPNSHYRIMGVVVRVVRDIPF